MANLVFLADKFETASEEEEISLMHFHITNVVKFLVAYAAKIFSCCADSNGGGRQVL
jgi:hypothetical protein